MKERTSGKTKRLGNAAFMAALAGSLALGAALAPQALAQSRDLKLNRTVLPIPEPNYPRSTVLDAALDRLRREALWNQAPPRDHLETPGARLHLTHLVYAPLIE